MISNVIGNIIPLNTIVSIGAPYSNDQIVLSIKFGSNVIPIIERIIKVI